MKITKEQLKYWDMAVAAYHRILNKSATGGYAEQASRINETKHASSGHRTMQASSGRGTRQASSGIGTTHWSKGAFSKVAVSGPAAEITAIGDYAVVAASDCVSKIVLGAGGCAAVPYHDGNRVRFAVAYVGENGIEAGIPYEVNEKGEFVKLEESDS